MKANWGVSTIFGVMAFICTFFFSLLNNTWQTSLFRAGIGFMLFFILGYLTMFSLKQISQKKMASHTNEKSEDEGKAKIDQERETEAKMDETDFQAIPLQALHNGDK
jgi:putative Mn2+ efflux pump MntP